jgi:hypothetical protein
MEEKKTRSESNREREKGRERESEWEGDGFPRAGIPGPWSPSTENAQLVSQTSPC